jgi:glycine betaine catabolism B
MTALTVTSPKTSPKTWLDRVTGYLTMYKLVLVLLGALAVISIIFAALGLLSFGWLDLLTSALVAIAATVVSSWLFALPFRVKTHPDSAFITGLLIFFVLPPGIANLGWIALAGVIASASKFILAWRGRHIFNPVAVGAFVVSILGLYSGWWLATAIMLPFVAIASFLVLYRTRRITMGVVFIVVATVILTVRTGDLATGLQFALVSQALVFFAGFMLSEPLTLPPRRWQVLLEAVVVAAVFSIPFSIGIVSSTPQLALLVGNVIAFAFGQRRAVVLELTGSRQLTPSTWEFAFRPRRPVRFAPGQFIELTVPHPKADFRGSRRVFSISSSPADDTLTVAMTMDPERPSSFKRALTTLAPGATVRATGIGGDFLLPTDPSVKTLLVAGGIGITPFSSQLAHAASSGSTRDVVVVYAVRETADVAYAEVLEGSGAKVVLVAPEAPDVLPLNWHYAGSGRITRDLLAASVPDIATRTAFVSGSPALVEDVRRMLTKLGSKRVVTDYFSGY